MSGVTTESIFKRLPSHDLLSTEELSSLGESDIYSLLRKFGLEHVMEEESDLDELRDMLCAFISSFDGPSVYSFHLLYEILAVFPLLEFEIVQSLVESNDGKLSSDMIAEFIDMSSSMIESLSPVERDMNSNVLIMSVSQLLNDHDAPLTIDRKAVPIVVNNECSPQVMGIAMNSSCGLNFLFSMNGITHTTRKRYLDWGVNHLHLCYRQERGHGDTHDSCLDNNLEIVSKQVYITSDIFNYCHGLEMVFDLFHYGWCSVKGPVDDSTWTPALEEAMLHLLIAVDDDLVMLVKYVLSYVHLKHLILPVVMCC